MVWLSATSAAHRSHSAKRLGRLSMVPTSWWRMSSSGPQAGEPARLSSRVTRVSRRL